MRDILCLVIALLVVQYCFSQTDQGGCLGDGSGCSKDGDCCSQNCDVINNSKTNEYSRACVTASQMLRATAEDGTQNKQIAQKAYLSYNARV